MSALVRWWKVHFLGAELASAIALALCFGLWVLWLGGAQPVASLLAGNRAAIYGTLASIFGSLLGFTIAAVSIILGYATSERMALVRDSKHYATLWRVFVAAMRALGLATIVALTGLILDRDATPQPIVLCLCVGALLLAVLRVVRCLWVVESVILVVTTPSRERPE